MADSKVSDLTSLASSASEDLLLIVDDPSGTPVSKKISLLNLFGSIAANVSISGTLSTSANNTLNGSNTVISSNVNFTSTKPVRMNSGTLTLASRTTVTSNVASTQFASGGMQGTIAWDQNYLYVATSNTVVERVALSAFAS